MSTNQNSSSKLRNIFVIKEQTHNFVVLFLAILLIFLSSFFLYECLKWEQSISMGIILVVIFFIFGFFKIITSSLLLIKLKKIKNELEPKRLNFYIYQSSWMRKRIATIWTTLSYLTIFLFIFLIYLIINLFNKNLLLNKLILISYAISFFGIIFIGFINYKIMNNNLEKGKRYISIKKINSYENILQAEEWNIFFKKCYIYLLFSLFIIPWIFMLSSKFRIKLNIWIKKIR